MRPFSPCVTYDYTYPRDLPHRSVYDNTGHEWMEIVMLFDTEEKMYRDGLDIVVHSYPRRAKQDPKLLHTYPAKLFLDEKNRLWVRATNCYDMFAYPDGRILTKDSSPRELFAYDKTWRFV